MLILHFLLTVYRDGKTPEEQIKQILAIAPILPGGNESFARKRYSIPDFHSHDTQSNNPSAAQHVDSKETASAHEQGAQPAVSRKNTIDSAEETIYEELGDKAAKAGAPALVPTTNGITIAGRSGTSLDTMPTDLGKALPNGNAQKTGAPLLNKASEDEFVDAKQ